MELEILEVMLVNLPNFSGFFVGIILMWRIVVRLMDYIEKHCDCNSKPNIENK